MMTSTNPLSDKIKNKRKALLLISMMILGQSLLFITPAGADSQTSQSSPITTFYNNDESVTVQFDSFGTQIQPTDGVVEIPQNTTIEQFEFKLSTSQTNPSPGKLSLDINQDGAFEYSFDGIGYGNLSNQTQFSDNNSFIHEDYSTSQVGVNYGPEIILPKNLIPHNSSLSIEFSPLNGGKWIEESSVKSMKIFDIDNDSSDELLLFSETYWNGEPSIGWLNNNTDNNGFTNISWVETCDYGEEIEVGDFNGDGYDDVLVWTSSLGRFCYHFWDNSISNFTSPTELTGGTSGEEIFVKAADLESDGIFEIVYADSLGMFGFYEWRGQSGFSEIGNWRFETRSGTGTLIEEGISQFDVGNIMLGIPDGTLVVISDTGTLETLKWDSSTSSFEYVLPSFPTGSFDTEFMMLGDVNGDNYDDILTWGSGTEGNLTESELGLGLYSISQQNGFEMPIGATFTDYNTDGVMDLLIPESLNPDNDDLTLEGSLQVFSFTNGIFVDTFMRLNPRTMPNYSLSGDLNGDLSPELIVFCGEQSLGIFIDSWHKISYDMDGDGTNELSAEGFVQSNSGPNSSGKLRMFDSTNIISGEISENLDEFPTFSDSNNNEMIVLSSELTIKSAGQVTFSNLQITYDWWNNLDELYDVPGNNLSTMVNTQYMEFGDQNFLLPLSFYSSRAGNITISDLNLVTSPGHPNLPDLSRPTLITTTVTEDSIGLSWNIVSTGNEYFESYKLFRSSVVDAQFPQDFVEIYSSLDYLTVSYNDQSLEPGGHYEYVVKVAFSVVGLESAPSVAVSIDLPSIPQVENVIASDTPNDLGGNIDISWDEVDDRYSGYYEVFVRPENFTDTTLLDSVVVVQSDVTSYTADYTSALRNPSGEIIQNALDLVNEQALWVAVVATNESGSNPYVSATGPIYPLNNEELDTLLEIDLSFAEVFGEEMRANELIVGGNEPTVISLTLTSNDADDSSDSAVSDATIMTTLTINPDGEEHKFYFNSTTDENGQSEVEFYWRDLANDSINVNGGVVEIIADFNGRAETLEKGGLSPSTVNLCQNNDACNSDDYVDIIVPAYFSLLTTVTMVDELGDATLGVSLLAEHEWQQAALIGTEITFKYYDNETGLLTGTPVKQSIQDLSGIIDVFIDAMPTGGYVLITPDSTANPNNPAAWKYLNNFELNATLVEYDDSGQTNLDDDNDFVLNKDDLCPNTPGTESETVDENGCSESQLANQIEIIDPELECPMLETFVDGVWVIQNIVNSQNSNLECEIINYNKLFLQFEYPENIVVQGVELGINCPDNYIASEGRAVCTFSPTVKSITSKNTSDPVQIPFEADFTFSWITPTGINQMKVISLGSEFSLNGEIVQVTDTNDEGSNNNGGTDNLNSENGTSDLVINEESVDSKAGLLEDPVILLSIGGGVFSIVLIIILIRYFRGDDDDWDDEWDDNDEEELENPLDRILGRNVGTTETVESSDEPFERENNRGRLRGSAGEEFVRQSQQTNDYEDDPNYSVDEDGTEWWEDDHGQWWYRDPDMDDWEEWNE